MNELLDKALKQGATVETGMQFVDYGSVVNFDLVDKTGNEVLAQAGYILIHKNLENRTFCITVVNAYSEEIFEVTVPMVFAGFKEEV